MRNVKGRMAAWAAACSLGMMALFPVNSGAQTGFRAEPGYKEFIRYTEPVIQADGGVVEAAALSLIHI